MKTHVIILSKFFPKNHINAGKPTDFKSSFLSKRKVHIIFTNYPLWEKRIKEVLRGEAFLSIRQWKGKPYRSSQEEITRLTAKHGVGIQKIS